MLQLSFVAATLQLLLVAVDVVAASVAVAQADAAPVAAAIVAGENPLTSLLEWNCYLLNPQMELILLNRFFAAVLQAKNKGLQILPKGNFKVCNIKKSRTWYTNRQLLLRFSNYNCSDLYDLNFS